MSLEEIIIENKAFIISTLVFVNLFTYLVKAIHYPFGEKRKMLEEEGINPDYNLIKNVYIIPTPFDIAFWLAYRLNPYISKSIQNTDTHDKNRY